MSTLGCSWHGRDSQAELIEAGEPEMPQVWVWPCAVMEHPESEGIHKDHRVQILALH